MFEISHSARMETMTEWHEHRGLWLQKPYRHHHHCWKTVSRRQHLGSGECSVLHDEAKIIAIRIHVGVNSAAMVPWLMDETCSSILRRLIRGDARSPLNY